MLISRITRRAFISALGSAAAWPARAQQRPVKIRHMGILQPGAPPAPLVEAMHGRLRELGYIERRDITFEYKWAEGKLEQLPNLATEFANLKPDVIAAFRACLQLSRMIAQASWTPARKFRASLS